MSPTVASQQAQHPVVVRDASKDDDQQLSDVLARAFWDDPVMSWMIPNDRVRYARQQYFYAAELSSVHRRGVVLTTDDQAGAALWLPPKQWKIPTRDLVSHGPGLLLAFARRIPVAIKLLDKIEKAHPSTPHWYLAILGTDPVRQGFGVGAALITTMTDRCDTEGIGAYLESSKATNVPYYRRFGFEVTEEITVPDGPTLWGMWRDPR